MQSETETGKSRLHVHRSVDNTVHTTASVLTATRFFGLSKLDLRTVSATVVMARPCNNIDYVAVYYILGIFCCNLLAEALQ